jgi:CRP/FNR family transcriptional regulator, dissimilatory nitrate respiration regulator
MHDFDSQTLKRLFGRQPERKLGRGEPLFRQGEPATRVFFIIRGRLRMIRHLVSGERITIHIGRAGELFAEGALFSDVYQCEAIAAEPTQIRACGKAEMLSVIGRSRSAMLTLLQRVTRSLHHARAMLELRNIRSADSRVLHHLRLSASKDGVVIFDRPLLEVAEDLGLTHEAYYRALAALAQKRVIKRSGRTIRLINSVS